MFWWSAVNRKLFFDNTCAVHVVLIGGLDCCIGWVYIAMLLFLVSSTLWHSLFVWYKQFMSQAPQQESIVYANALTRTLLIYAPLQ